MCGKNTLRKEYLDKRKALNSEVIEEKSQRIALNFSSFFQDHHPKTPFQNIHVFLPIRKHHEVNTWFIIDFLRKINVQVIISTSNLQSFEMEHFILEEDTLLKENSWGVPEPHNARSFDIKELDLVLIPLLTFDQSGYRIGYGKGFYDRFLDTCPIHAIKVGLSIFPPIDTVLPDSHDIPMQYCITPDETFSFEKNI